MLQTQIFNFAEQLEQSSKNWVLTELRNKWVYQFWKTVRCLVALVLLGYYLLYFIKDTTEW